MAAGVGLCGQSRNVVDHLCKQASCRQLVVGAITECVNDCASAVDMGLSCSLAISIILAQVSVFYLAATKVQRHSLADGGRERQRSDCKWRNGRCTMGEAGR